MCMCGGGVGLFPESGAVTKDYSFTACASGAGWGLGHMSEAGGPAEGGVRLLPAGHGVPQHRLQVLGVMELNGNAVLIYMRLLSFYKTIAVYEESLLS